MVHYFMNKSDIWKTLILSLILILILPRHNSFWLIIKSPSRIVLYWWRITSSILIISGNTSVYYLDYVNMFS